MRHAANSHLFVKGENVAEAKASEELTKKDTQNESK